MWCRLEPGTDRIAALPEVFVSERCVGAQRRGATHLAIVQFRCRMERQPVLDAQRDIDGVGISPWHQFRHHPSVGLAVQRDDVTLQVLCARHGSFGDRWGSLSHRARRVILRAGHAQATDRAFHHAQIDDPVIDALARQLHRDGGIARAIIGILQRVPRLFDIGGGLAQSDMRQHHLFNRGRCQHGVADHPDFQHGKPRAFLRDRGKRQQQPGQTEQHETTQAASETVRRMVIRRGSASGLHRPDMPQRPRP